MTYENIVGDNVPVSALKDDQGDLTIYLQDENIQAIRIIQGVKIPKKQTFQEKIKQLHENEYITRDRKILALQLASVTGEICETVTLVNIPSREHKTVLKLELEKCLELVCTIANSTGIDLGI